MKKLLVSVSVLVLLFCMIVPAHAATTVSVNSQEASRGDTVTFDAAISGSVVVGSGSVSVSYDSSVLELVSGSCGVGGAMLATFDANTGLGAFAFQGTGTA